MSFYLDLRKERIPNVSWLALNDSFVLWWRKGSAVLGFSFMSVLSIWDLGFNVKSTVQYI